MLNIIKFSKNHVSLSNIKPFFQARFFLSQAYQCQEVWERRLNSPVLQRVNLDELYHELDQRFQKTRQISAVDVDIFANALTDDSYIDELMDLVHKLRLSAETTNTLDSTPHAVVRHLKNANRHNELLNVVDDRLNYGIFLDYYTANLLMDTFWKNKNFVAGARVASQLMLQEEFDHPLANSLALLHCYNYLLKPEGWPEEQKPEEPEEEVKVRVRYLRNPYDDDHFDLRDPNKIVGKTIAQIAKFSKDGNKTLNKSFEILGLALQNKNDIVKFLLESSIKEKTKLCKEVLELAPNNEVLKELLPKLQLEMLDVPNLLTEQVKIAERAHSEKDIANMCENFAKWEECRMQALEEQKQRMQTAKRLADIEDIKKAIKDKETKLWFFEKEEEIELAIEAKKIYYPKRWFGKKKKPRVVDESYVPPEVYKQQ